MHLTFVRRLLIKKRKRLGLQMRSRQKKARKRESRKLMLREKSRRPRLLHSSC